MDPVVIPIVAVGSVFAFVVLVIVPTANALQSYLDARRRHYAVRPPPLSRWDVVHSVWGGGRYTPTDGEVWEDGRGERRVVRQVRDSRGFPECLQDVDEPRRGWNLNGSGGRCMSDNLVRRVFLCRADMELSRTRWQE